MNEPLQMQLLRSSCRFSTITSGSLEGPGFGAGIEREEYKNKDGKFEAKTT